jgi:hypothetical protein
MSDDPKQIWLAPWCSGCQQHSYEGRLWCEDNVWEECQECGNKPVRYLLADKQPQKEDAGEP